MGKPLLYESFGSIGVLITTITLVQWLIIIKMVDTTVYTWHTFGSPHYNQDTGANKRRALSGASRLLLHIKNTGF